MLSPTTLQMPVFVYIIIAEYSHSLYLHFQHNRFYLCKFGRYNLKYLFHHRTYNFQHTIQVSYKIYRYTNSNSRVKLLLGICNKTKSCIHILYGCMFWKQGNYLHKPHIFITHNFGKLPNPSGCNRPWGLLSL
jgi:hypothetical protein